MAVIDSGQRTSKTMFRMNGRKIYKLIKGGRVVYEDKHTPVYSFSCWDNGGGAVFRIIQSEAVPYSVTYKCYCLHGYNWWALEKLHTDCRVAITFAPGETGTKEQFFSAPSDGLTTASWVRGECVESIVLGNEV